MPSDWTSLPALTRWKSGVGDQQVRASGRRPGLARPSRAPRGRTAAGAAASSCGSCARCRGASTRGARRSPFQGSTTICSPSSIALARTTSSSAVSRATLPISLRYIRTGSSIPIMSAESASSSSAVGSSTSFGVELRRRVDAGRRDGPVGGVDRLLRDDLDAQLRGARLRVLVGAEVDVLVVVVVVLAERRRHRPSARRGRMDASSRLFQLAPGAAGARARTASTSCLSRGSAMSAGPPVGSVGRWVSGGGGSKVVGVSPPPPACGRGGGSGRAAGRATGAAR